MSLVVVTEGKLNVIRVGNKKYFRVYLGYHPLFEKMLDKKVKVIIIYEGGEDISHKKKIK